MFLLSVLFSTHLFAMGNPGEICLSKIVDGQCDGIPIVEGGIWHRTTDNPFYLRFYLDGDHDIWATVRPTDAGFEGILIETEGKTKTPYQLQGAEIGQGDWIEFVLKATDGSQTEKILYFRPTGKA